MDQKEHAFRLTLLISSFVLVIFIIIFTHSIMWYHRKRMAVQKELEKRNLAKLEQERHRIAEGLQNLLSPIFYNILLHLNQLVITERDGQQILAETNKLVTETINQLQALTNILLPHRLKNEGLTAALQDLSKAIRAIFNLPILIEDNPIPRLSSDKEILVFRMIEEILYNTATHAKASQVLLNISSSDKSITLIISDDGVGLDLPTVQKENQALGLRTILAQADLLNAEIFLEGKKGMGTTYLITIPVS